MDTEEREGVMGQFKRGEIEILVSTTVIEVGIDVPNATTIVVEHAERFGLSQLHQLRGRVGRGTAPSQCLLLHYGGGREEARIRLKVIEEIQDGFRIAEEDLKLRGPGELLGVRQSGLPDFRLASLLRDSDLLFRARRAALDWLSEDPTLIRKESQGMKEILSHRWGERLELGSIG
jgi:ATP-dependent DNA helicase RecG